MKLSVSSFPSIFPDKYKVISIAATPKGRRIQSELKLYDFLLFK